jgi:hypothetical protein
MNGCTWIAADISEPATHAQPSVGKPIAPRMKRNEDPVACCIRAVTSLGYHAPSSRVMPDDRLYVVGRHGKGRRMDDSVLRGSVDFARRCTLAIKSADEVDSSFRKTDVYHCPKQTSREVVE